MPLGTSSAVRSTRVPPSTAVTSHVMVIVPAKAGSSETKSTAWTTRTSGTCRLSRLDDVGISRGLPAERGSVVYSYSRRSLQAADRIARTCQSFHQAGATPRGPPDRQGCIDLRWRGGDDPRCGVRARIQNANRTDQSAARARSGLSNFRLARRTSEGFGWGPSAVGGRLRPAAPASPATSGRPYGSRSIRGSCG